MGVRPNRVNHPRHPVTVLPISWRVRRHDRRARPLGRHTHRKLHRHRRRRQHYSRHPITMRVCSTPGCATIFARTEGSRCLKHRVQAETLRGTSTQRGYTSRAHQRFRTHVLNADPICVNCGIAQATIADHYPQSRKDLLALGLNANDPRYGRGLCKRCHDRSTAAEQPGGWNARPEAV